MLSWNSDLIMWMLQLKLRLFRPCNIFFQSSILQFLLGCVNYSLSVLLFSDRSSTWCGVLPQESICFNIQPAVKDRMPYTLTLISSYLSNCFLSIISNQSYQYTPTSNMNKIFLSQLWLTNFFSFTVHSLWIRDGCVWKSQQINSFWNTQMCLSGISNSCSNCIKFPFFLTETLRLNFTKLS